MMPSWPSERLWKSLILAVVYAITAKLALALAFEHPSVTAVWPPTGIALAATLLWGSGIWPGLLAGAFLANVTTAGSALTSLAIAVGNTLEAMLGYYLVTRFAGGRAAFDGPHGVLKFVGLAGLLSTTVSATCGVTSLVLGGYAGWTHYGSMWSTWWLGDVGGALIVAPLLLLWSRDTHIRWTRRYAWEVLVALLLVVATAEGVFGGWLPTLATDYPVLSMPVIAWVAFRFSQRDAATAVALLSGLAVWGTLRGFGPFAGRAPHVSFLWLGAFMSVAAAMALVLAAAMAERTRLEREHEEEVLKRERADQALRAGSRFRALLESAPDAMVIVDAQGTIVFINSQTETLFGYSRDELVGRPVEVLVPRRAEQAHATHRARYTADPHVRPMGPGLDLFGRRRDGREFPVEISLSPIATEDGVLISSAIRDVSSRKRAEEALAHLAAIIEFTGDAIISQSLDGTVLSWNPGAQRLYGYSAEEIVGRPISLLTPPGEEDEVRELLDLVRHGKRVESYETTRRRKDGRPVSVSLSISPVRDSVGWVTAGSVIARDITDKKRAEEALREANRELEAFTYSVSHDLRAPLRGLRAVAEALLEDYGDVLDETGREYARHLRSAAAQMDALTLNLLTYSRVDRAEARLGPVELGPVVAEVLGHLKAEIEARNARISVSPVLPAVLGDETTLTQVVSNLVGNAIKFGEPGISPQVGIRADDQDGWVRLCVEDNGIGIDPRHQQRIFQVFERLHDGDTYPGTGLGLAIARKGVQRMGGRIGVESEPGRGSRFWIELRKEIV